MKKKLFPALLAAEAAALILPRFFSAQPEAALLSLAALPFAPIGAGLRALSLSGSGGNTAAVALYVLLCLLPTAALLPLRRRGLHPEDGILVLLSLTLFPVLYYEVNPGLSALAVSGGTGAVRGVLGGLCWSLLAAWAVLRILRLFYAADAGKLRRCAAALLGILGIYFVYRAAGACVSAFLSDLDALHAGNRSDFPYDAADSLLASEVFLGLQALLSALPEVCSLLLVFSGLALVESMEGGRFTDGSVAAAETLARRSRLSLTVTVLGAAGLNLLQFLLAGKLLVIRGTLYLPLPAAAFALATLLLARFIAENKRLRDDNDLFI